MPKFGVNLLAYSRLVPPLETVQRILARWIIGGHDDHFLKATVCSDLAGSFVKRIVLIGHAEKIVITLGARELTGAWVVRQVRDFSGKERWANGKRHVRTNRSGKEIDFVALYVTTHQLAGLIGVAAHVCLDKLSRLPTKFAA